MEWTYTMLLNGLWVCFAKKLATHCHYNWTVRAFLVVCTLPVLCLYLCNERPEPTHTVLIVT